MVEIATADVGDVRVAYEIRGASNAPPMMLLHALGDGRRDWDGVADRFAENFQVVAVDLRGHGESDWPGAYSFELMALDVIGLLDHLGLAAVTLVGHSMGGAVAYLIAQQYPDRVERLIVEDVPPPFPRDRPLPARPEGKLEFDWAVVPAIVGEVNRGNATMWDQLSSVKAPTLIIAGGPDSHIPQEKLQEVAERIPDCTLITIPAGHNVHAQRPRDFGDAVLDWLARTPSP
jgi:pimeloyl-ACP methyl ester carboxylesterase